MLSLSRAMVLHSEKSLLFFVDHLNHDMFEPSSMKIISSEKTGQIESMLTK